MFEYLVSRWNCLGKLNGRGLTRGAVPPSSGFEVSEGSMGDVAPAVSSLAIMASDPLKP